MKQKNIIFLLLFLLFLSPACSKTSETIKKDEQNYLTYQNKDYYFEIEYPKNWVLRDCKDSYPSQDEPKLMVVLSDNENINCSFRGGRINLMVRERDNLYRIKEEEIREKKIIVLNDIEIEQNIVYYEIKDDEGQTKKTKPMEKEIITFIPYKDKFIVVCYNELYEFLGDLTNEPEDMKPQNNFEDIYNRLIGSFKFTSNTE